MKAITVEPMKASSARYWKMSPNQILSLGSILVEAVAVGVCGTDVEIVTGKYGWAPPDKERLVLGHESLGRVIDPGAAPGFQKGDLVVGIVRRPDPVPCPNCAVGEWDMCRNGQYTERGIKAIDGYMSERWRIEPEYAMKVDPSLGILGVLLEPTTVVTKALGSSACGGRSLVLGAAKRAHHRRRADRSVGCAASVYSAAWMSTCWIALTGPKVDLVEMVGATYHSATVSDLDFEPDMIIECTGVGQVIVESSGKSGLRWRDLPHWRRPWRSRFPAWRLPMSPPLRCLRTTSLSVASTQTSVTGTKPANIWPRLNPDVLKGLITRPCEAAKFPTGASTPTG